MKRIISIFYTVLISVLVTSFAFSGGISGTIGNMPPMAPQEDHGVVFRYDPSRNPTLDFASRTKWAQTYAGTNRTRINSAGLLETVAANVPVIDHVGASLTPALRLEPEAANILLEVVTDWTKTTATVTKNAVSWAGAASGAWTIVSGGANATVISTAVTATSAAFTFVCAMKRSVGTGSVYMTIDNGSTWTEKTLTTSFQYFSVTKTAANPQLGFKLATIGDEIIVDCLMLVPNTAIASSYFAPAAAIGSELVTDGAFDAVTETPIFSSDFSAGTDGWIANEPSVTTLTGNIDYGGETDVLRAMTNGSAEYGQHFYKTDFVNIFNGDCGVLSFKYFIPSTNSHVNGIGIDYPEYHTVFNTVDSWTTVSLFYYNVHDIGSVSFWFMDDGEKVLNDSGDYIYVKNIVFKKITFTNWTAGTGWAPQATAGALTGKCQKIAGTASFLIQNLAVSGKVSRNTANVVVSIGTLYMNNGSGSQSPAITSTGAYTHYLIGSANTNSGFYAGTDFAGTVDDVSIKEHGTVRISEANTITLAVHAAVSAALAATGTLVVDWMPGFAKTASASCILAATPATASLLAIHAGADIQSYDGTTSALSAAVYTANVLHRLAVQWPSSANKYKVGVSVAMAGISWGAESAFDGAFTVGANLIPGYTLHGPMWIKSIKFYNKLLTAAQINAM